MSLENNLTNKAKTNKGWRPFSNLIYDIIMFSGAIPAYAWLRPKIYYPFGRPSKKGALLISANHRSLMDPVVVLTSFPMHRINSVATSELYSSKFLTFMFNQMHCIKIDKNNFSVSSFHEIVERLNHKKKVLIFPEGQLNQDQSMLAFKSGIILMAHKSGAPIVPMYIPERERWYHRQLHPMVDQVGK